MILITGGAGFIGANIVTALQGREPIAVLDRFGTDDKWKNLRHAAVDRFVFREEHKGSMRSVMTTHFEHLRDGGSLRLFRSDRSDYPDGGQKRDFVHVDDCVAVIAWMLDNDFPSDLYNIGTGKARTWLDVGAAMFAALDREPAIEFIDMPP